MTNLLRRARRWVVGIAILAVIVTLVRSSGIDPAASLRVIAAAGPALAWVLVPFALVALLDGVAWSYALDLPAAARRSAALVVRTRVSLESLALTIPGSALASDGFAPALIRRLARTDLASAISGVALKKWGFVVGHVTLLALAASIGGAYLARLDAHLELAISPRAFLAIATLVGASLCALFALVLRGGVAARLQRLAERLPNRVVADRARAAADAAARTDSAARGFFAGRPSRIASLVAVSTAVWIAESFEVYTMLVVLGASPAPQDVLAMEAVLTILRGLAVFSPGALGVQEVAYMSFVPALSAGGPEVASALIVLRRTRDLVCIALGYALVAATFGSRRALADAGRDDDGIAYDSAGGEPGRATRGRVVVGMG